MYNELRDGKKIYYTVVAFDNNVLRIEQFKNQPKEDIKEAINLQKLFNDEKISIVYYAYGGFKKIMSE